MVCLIHHVSMIALSLPSSSLFVLWSPVVIVVDTPAPPFVSSVRSHLVSSNSEVFCPNCAYGFRERLPSWVRGTFGVLQVLEWSAEPSTLGAMCRKNFFSVGIVPQITRRLHSSWDQTDAEAVIQDWSAPDISGRMAARMTEVIMVLCCSSVLSKVAGGNTYTRPMEKSPRTPSF